MSKILVAYATNAGSTAEIAATVADTLYKAGHIVGTHPIDKVDGLSAYDAVVIGAPMIFGWHVAARRFVRRNQAELSGKKVAYFACAMRLTRVPGASLPTVPLTLDANLAAEPAKAGALSLKERFTALGYYLKPMLAAAPRVKPVNVAFFGGSLDMRKLKWWQAVFVMGVVQATPGDYRDWDAIRAWSKSLGGKL